MLHDWLQVAVFSQLKIQTVIRRQHEYITLPQLVQKL